MDTTVDIDIICYKLNAAFIEESHLDAASEILSNGWRLPFFVLMASWFELLHCVDQ